MSSDLEHLLEQLTLRGAPLLLRERVLAHLGQELKTGPAVHLRRWGWVALAASLLLGVALNVGLAKGHEARRAQIYGPKPVPRQIEELTRTVAKMTDAQTASELQQELLEAVRQQRAAAAQANHTSGFCSLMSSKD